MVTREHPVEILDFGLQDPDQVGQGAEGVS
jgi:hypothetical protein